MKKINKRNLILLVVFDHAGSFAENKDIARDLREKHILPALSDGKDIVFDYAGVDSTTQSFTHALISESIRKFGEDVLDRMSFKNCNDEVKRIISIVVEYMQGNTSWQPAEENS
jgi:STAS-like domain of unknown function (DUF4325)